MTLDIIVPRYKEPWETGKYLFDTLVPQRGVDFNDIRVILVNDGEEDLLDPEVFKNYPFRVDYLPKPHGGVSAARNYGLDHATADYVMFCDFDDGFLNNYGIHLIFSAAVEGFDVMTSCFIEEVWNDKEGKMAIVRHDKDAVFIHGKAYRRQFLVDNNLRFDPDLTLHEDSFFNHLCMVTADDQIRDVGTPFYLWRWNDNSTVRQNKEHFVLRTYPELMKVRMRICEELKKRDFVDAYFTCVCKTVLDSFYDFNKTEYCIDKNAKMAREAEKAFRKFWMKYGDSFNECNMQRIGEIAVASRAIAYEHGLKLERFDLRTWLKHIENEVKP